MTLALTLITAVVALALWVTFGFIIPVSGGAVHLLYAVGAVLLVVWVAKRDG